MIKIDSVSKKYSIYARPIDRLYEMISFSKRRHHKEFWALKDISLTVGDGSTFGIVGPNGAGKSTLLKILAGVTQPTSGRVELSGRIASLLELGAGFHPEFTGRQNIIFNATMLGLREEEIQEKMDAIIAFAEIGDFLDQPIRTYSSGMYIRLGFAIASCVDPKILLVDEALSVGDAYFQQKCIKRIRKFKEEGTTILFVTHDMGIIKTLCDQTALLEEGKLIGVDTPENILEYYNALVAKKITGTVHIAKSQSHTGEVISNQRFGNFQAIVREIKLTDDKGQELSAVISGQKIIIEANIIFLSEIENPTFGILIRDRLGNDIFGTNSYHLGIQPGIFNDGDSLNLRFSLDLNLGPGVYTLTVATHSFDMHIFECYDWADRILSFKVIPSSDFTFVGVSKLYPTVEYQRKNVGIKGLQEFIANFFDDAPSVLDMNETNQKFLRSGWYEPEFADNKEIRWTTRNFSFILQTLGKKVRIDFSCCNPELTQKPIRGQLLSFNDTLYNFNISNPNETRLEVELPEEWQNRVLLFHVQLDTDWCPNDYFQNQDKRRVGIAVSKIWMENK